MVDHTYIFFRLDKNKKATINSINDNDNCFQYEATAALNYEGIENSSQVICTSVVFCCCSASEDKIVLFIT